jgi:hypothetical protein
MIEVWYTENIINVYATESKGRFFVREDNKVEKFGV